MRRLIFGAFLLSTTALVPTPAHAMPPVLGFIGGILTAIGAPTLGTAIATVGGFSVGSFAAGVTFGLSPLGGAVISGAISVGLSYLSSLLQPRQRTPEPGARLVNVRQPLSYMEIVYGLVRKGGPIAFWKRLKGKRYYSVILAAHEIDGIVGYYADERDVAVDADGLVTDERLISNGESRLRMVAHLGGAGQVASAILMAAFPGQWTAAHDMAGLAHIVTVAENTVAEDFQKVFPTGREPVIAPLFRGKKVYDPRDADQVLGDPTTYKWSTNAALIIADWATSADGLDAAVDWTGNVAVEADASDVTVTDRDGNTLPKWQLCGSFSLADEREIVRAQMGVACDAFFSEDSEGRVVFHVGRWIEPDVTIEDGDILSVRYRDGQDGTAPVNAQVLEYTEASIGYRQHAAAACEEIGPDEPYRESGLQTFWIPNHNQAVRVEKRLLRAARAKYTLSQVVSYQGARLLGKRTFRQRHLEAGIDMDFEIDKLTRNEDRITWTIEAHSVEPGDFDFEAATEEPPMPARISFDVDDSVPEPEGVALAAEPVAGGVGIRASWDPPERDSLLFQMRYRVHSPAGDWTLINVPQQQNHQIVGGVDDGETYDVQVRTITATGQASEWVPNDGNENNPTLSITVVIDTVAPQALLAFTAADGAGQFIANFGTLNDTHLATVAIYRAPTGVPLDRAAHIVGPRYAVAPGISYALPITSAPGSYDVYVEPFNRSGIAGPLSGPDAATVT